MTYVRSAWLAVVLWLCAVPAFAQGVLAPGGGAAGGLPAVGNEGDCLLVTSGVPAWGVCPSAGSGAPTDAKYITQTANGTLSAEQALATLATGIMKVTTTTGVISVAVAGTDYVAPAGNVATATALAADPADCAANNFATAINASGTLTCGQPSISAGVSGLGTGVAMFLGTPSSANLATALTNETGSGAAVFGTAPTLTGATITTSLNIPNSTTLPATCAVGDLYMDTDATSGQRIYACQATNTWALQGDGSTGSIGGTTGATDNAVLRADGVGGATVQASGCTLSDTDQMTCPGGFVAGTSGAGVITLLEGTVVSAGTNAGEHNLGIDSSDSRLKSRENAGSLVTYAITADKLSAFAATTSAELRGVLSDESGTGAAIFAGGNIGAGDATTPAANDNDTSIATTAYVQTELTGYASDSVAFTNKAYDAEGTGNVLTIPRRIWLPAAGCNNATAGNIWDLPTSNPAVPACKTGTNTQMGVLDFADGSNLSAQITYKLPSTWTGTMDANIKWLTSATTGSVVWQVQTICVADAETDDPAFNTASTVTDAAKGTTLQTNDAAITGVTTTGCAAGELMHIKILRDSAHASDTLAATARLIGVELVVREAI